MQLEGKVALITGGGRGIGRSIARAFAGEGAAVIVSARTQEEIDAVAIEIQQAGGTASAWACDVRDVAAVDRLFQHVIDQHGRLDILVNNAGGSFVRAPVATSDRDAWKRVIDVNLLGVYYCSYAALPIMQGQGGGKIINIGSGMGHSPRAGNSAYNSAKAGVWMFTRCLAMEVWEQGIDVNEIVPGPVLTELTKDLFEIGKAPPIAPSERVKTPEECVPLAMFLAAHPPGGPTGQSFSLARRPI